MDPRLERSIASFSDALMEAVIAPSWSGLGYSARRWLEGWDHQVPAPMDGKVVVLTGFTSGIGLAAATRLGELGATLHLVGRDPGRTSSTAESLAGRGFDVHTSIADMGDLDAVRSIAGEITNAHQHLDALIHNAGALSAEYTVSPQGFEMTVASQVLGPFLLTSLLLPLLEAGESSGRVIAVASGGMYPEKLDVEKLVAGPNSYNGVRAYARSKRAQVELNVEWARRSGSGVIFQAMHPGWVDTPGVVKSLPRFHSITKPVLRSAEAGADTIVWLADVDAKELGANGGFWLDRHRRSITKIPGTSASQSERDRLWQWCEDNSGSGRQPS
jgi:NAD(P)-dependent dehydrogenase (short-subunit alcohol dehydrogenase family)